MAYALIEDIPASWEQYAPIGHRLAQSPPGLLLHLAGPTDEGFRIIEVWASEGDWRAFTEAAGGTMTSGAGRSTPIVRDLRVVRTHIGDAWPGNEGDTGGHHEQAT